VVPVGALKKEQSTTSTTSAMTDGLQVLAEQREAASERHESAQMVSAMAAKEHMDKKLDLAAERMEIHRRRVDREEQDRALIRSLCRDEHMISIIDGLHKAGMQMSDFLAQRAALMCSDAAAMTTPTAPAASATATTIADTDATEEPLDQNGLAPPPPPQEDLVGGLASDGDNGGDASTREKVCMSNADVRAEDALLPNVLL